MFMKLRLLISLFLLIPSLAFANTEISGFLFGTTFQQRNWYKDNYVVAINVDYTNDIGLAVRGQTSSHENTLLRRLTIEYDKKITENSEGIIKLGRFPRISSFYDSISDSSFNYGMAILPQAGYSYRMYNGAFVMMDGYQLVYTHTYNDIANTLYFSKGTMAIDDHHELTHEVFKKHLDDISIEGRDSIDVSWHIEFNNIHAYTSLSEYYVYPVQKQITPLSTYITTKYSLVDYLVERYGIQYKNNIGYIQTERIYGKVDTTTKAGIESNISKSLDVNYVVGLYFKENFSIYYTNSIGENLITNKINKDESIGISYNKYPYSISTEYHVGKSDAGSWVDYDYNATTWNSIVTSLAYHF